MNIIRYIVVGFAGTVATAGYPAADCLAFCVDQHQCTACMEDVPIKRTPDMTARRIATIPEGTAVNVDRGQDR